MHFLGRLSLPFATVLAGVVSPALHAQPVVLHEEARIELPSVYFIVSDVCLHADDLLVLARRAADEAEWEYAWTLVQFRKQADGRWAFINEIASTTFSAATDIWINEQLDCNGPLAAMSTPEGAQFVAEHTSSGWKATVLPDLSWGSAASAHRDAVAIAGGWRGPNTVAVVRKDAAGQWGAPTYAIGNPGSLPDYELIGPERVWLTTSELVANSTAYAPPGQNETVYDTQWFDLVNGAWRLATLPRAPGAAVISDRVALQMPPWSTPGEVAAFHLRDGSGAWSVKHSLLSDELFAPLDTRFMGERAYAASRRNAGEIALFQSGAPRRYDHVATLSPSDLPAAPGSVPQFSVYGEWVAMTRGRAVYLFRTSAPPAPLVLEQTFQNGHAAWTFSGDASFSTVSSGGTRLLRQSRTSGGAFAILSGSQSDDQSIQADVRINELGSGTPWAGFVLRYTDARNYYYLLVNRTSVQIRKIVNGVYGPIATAPFTLSLGRWYNFRVEAVGSRLRMFVNGRQVGEVIDDSHPRGRAGLTMWRARTDYDNVIVTDRPQSELFVDDFNGRFRDLPTPWRTIAPANAWSIATLSSGERVYRQNLLESGPRTVNGGLTTDQIISVTVRPTAFHAAGNGWVGVMARYTDNFNNYFLMLHQSGRASLRKRVNGVYTLIEEIPFTVSPNTTYRLRIEALGSSLRAYVNERLVAEGVDDDLPSGRYGLVTFNARADFDNFRALRP